VSNANTAGTRAIAQLLRSHRSMSADGNADTGIFAVYVQLGFVHSLPSVSIMTSSSRRWNELIQDGLHLRPRRQQEGSKSVHDGPPTRGLCRGRVRLP
jgi:hypothetical protein